MKGVVLIIALTAIIAIPVLEASAEGSEFGIGLPVSTSFSFTSLSVGLDAYYRLAGALLAWETALSTNFSFSSLYIRNTLATAGAFFVSLGHVTSLLPSFGSTYFTGGLGFALGQVLVFRVALNLAFSVSGGSFYFFPEIRFQFGINP